MTSSLRKTVHRRNHKERGQLAHRTKLGILEKHQDYAKRARDYHSKQERLNRLRQKAADRNKDEFYFSMSREKTKGGIHRKDRGNVALPTDIVKVLKTQDENYIRTMKTSNRKKIDRLKFQLTAMVDLLGPLGGADTMDLDEEDHEILIDSGILPASSVKAKGKAFAKSHIVFADSVEDWRQRSAASTIGAESSDPSGSNEQAGEDDLGWKVPASKKKRVRSPAETQPDDGAMDLTDEVVEDDDDDSQRRRGRLLKELSARIVRDTQLGYALREFEMQRALMGKGAKKKLAAPEKVGAEGGDSDADEFDAPRSKRRAQKKSVVDPSTYKPRVYKWKQERKR